MGFSGKPVILPPWKEGRAMNNDRARAYADAGVNISAGNAFVDRIRQYATGARTRGVISDIGGLAGFSGRT